MKASDALRFSAGATATQVQRSIAAGGAMVRIVPTGTRDEMKQHAHGQSRRSRYRNLNVSSKFSERFTANA
jgi:hypothetical protein